jgi:hypothetical protein
VERTPRKANPGREAGIFLLGGEEEEDWARNRWAPDEGKVSQGVALGY